ncbi:MAG: preprotein translocase subunit YajC [Clostridia bacterium]|nr:preprotein translocase subunit YajC [Clostridia bacterium]
MNMILLVVVYAVIFGAMYFIFIRPNRKKQKEEQKMRENLQIGDEVITIGGIYGRVISLKEDSMVIESKADRSKLTVARWALQQNLTVHDDAAKK